jgi:uncharacterized membrane protein YfcA
MDQVGSLPWEIPKDRLRLAIYDEDITILSGHTLIDGIQLIYPLVLLATGVAVGFACGLLGVGGGFIMVPVQIWALTSTGIEYTIATRVALGTSLAVILPTALSGCRGHACLGVVLWRPGISLGISGLVGAFIGGTIASHAPGDLLQKFFGIVVLAGALRMLFSGRYAVKDSIAVDIEFKGISPKYILLGFAVGIVSGLSGIGGGVILVPAMVIAMNFDMHQAVGTSSIAIAIISTGGILSYALNGYGVSGLPPYSLGYINLFYWVLLVGTSIFMTKVGVRFAHRLPAERLSYLFIILMLYVGLGMMGAFEWLHMYL